VPSTRRHTDSQSVSVCDVISGDVHVCVQIARALGLEHALLFSTRREPSAHGRHRLSIVCVDHVATVHFSAAPIFRYCSRTQRRSVYPYDNTLV